MSAWPQIAIIGWLTVAAASALVGLVRPYRGWIVITQPLQRVASGAFGLAIIAEGLTLWAGGFFKGLF